MNADPAGWADIVFLMPALRGELTSTELAADGRKVALLVEYACWNRHLVDWRSRRSPDRQRVDERWLNEGRVLFEELDKLRSAARRTGVLC